MSEGKGVGDMSDGWGVEESVDGYDVEACGAIEPTLGFHEGLGTADDSFLLGAVYGLLGLGVVIRPVAADFEEDELSAVASDEVDLGWAGVDVAGKDAQALFFEEFFG